MTVTPTLSKVSEHRWIVLLLALAVFVSSTYRIPILDQLDVVKLGIFTIEMFCVIMLVLVARRHGLALMLTIMLLSLLAIRILVGLLVASLLYDQPPAVSLQEARFGVSIVTIPLWYALARVASDTTLLRFAWTYIVLLAVVDGALLIWLLEEDMLVLAARTDSRYMVSIISPLAALILVAIRRHQRGDKNLMSLVLGAAILAAHSLGVTTSRVESLMSLGSLGFMLCLRWRGLRWFTGVALLALVIVILNVVPIDTSEGIGGRDFAVALSVAISGMPFGYGLTVDTVIRTAHGLPETMFFSDYGLLLYVFRYGAIGLMLIAALIYCWFRFVLVTRHLSGISMLALPMLVYIVFIPVLDYGALNGAVLIALMLVLGNRGWRTHREGSINGH